MSPFGFFFLIIFLFLLFGRICDFYLTRLHLPLLFSLFSLIAMLFSPVFFTVFQSRIAQFLCLYTVWLWLAIPFSYWKGGSFWLVADGWSKAFGTFLLVAALTTTVSQSIKVIRTLSYAMLLAAILAVTHGATIAGRVMHAQGLYAGPNELASAMLLGCICAGFVVFNPAHGGLRKALAGMSIFPLLLIMVKTGSRAAMVALAVVLLVLLKRCTLGQRVVLVLAVTAGIVISTVVVPDQIFQRYFTYFSAKMDTITSEEELTQRMMAVGSSSTRLYILMTSISFTIQHPFFGVGPGQFAVAENMYATGQGEARGRWLGTHNTYTEISSEAGLPALFFYVACLLACRKTIVTVERSVRMLKPTVRTTEIALTAYALKMILLCFTVFYMFEHSGYAPFFPAIAGLILAFGRAAQQEISQMQADAVAATV